MKTKNFVHCTIRLFLMTVIIFGLFPSTQSALAKPLMGAFTNCASQSEIPETECDALVALYNSTTGPGWTNHTNWLQTDTPCNWFGVTCNEGHVIKLILGGQNGSGWGGNVLIGTIPTEIGNLPNLTVLILADNQLSGFIPTELENLTHLTTLNLNKNLLTGSIPTELGSLTNLTMLDLSLNQLSGAIPAQLGNLVNLEQLFLNSNQLTGSIPPELGSLTKLNLLYLSRNQLTGSIPTQFGNLTKLTDLFLHNNQLTGNIPTTLGSLAQLKSLWLDDNQLTGSIPSTLGNLWQLQSLILYHNYLSGSIPTSLGNLTNLTKLDLGYNQLTGSIPTQLGNLTKLTHLHLGANYLSGTLPAQLTNLTKLTLLVVSNTSLSGSLPINLGNLTQLQWLWLNDTQIQGEIPTSFVNLAQLTNLTLSCKLTSTDPKVISFVNKILSPGWESHCSNNNDDFSKSIVISYSPYTRTQSSFATTAIDDPIFPCGTQTKGVGSIWYTFVPDVSGTLTVNTFGSNYDTMLAVWKGTRGYLVNSGCNDDTSGHGYQSQVTVNVIAKKPYYIEIAGYNSSGTSVLNASFSGPTPTPTRTLTRTPTPTPTRTPVTLSKVFTSTGSQDGWILESSETSNQGGTMNSTDTTFKLGDNLAKKQFKGILSFNTGATLPDTAIITNVILKVKKQSLIGGSDPLSIFQGFMIDMKKGSFGTSALQISDFQVLADNTYGPSTRAPINNWYSIHLTNGKGNINKLSAAGGLTQIRLRFKLDDNNNATNNYINFYSGDATAIDRPQLIVQYYVP